ncbi:MAG: aminotransferase class I/II-fold pyridoxal phosphate-dependent enzyme, partial [Panacibacter sp.]
NPTGNNINRADIEFLLNNFSGVILIDEAYINYSNQKTFIPELTEYANLIVMQTLSKAWGLAALRVGIGFASLDIIDLFNKVKPPYNINQASQELALQALAETNQVNDWIRVTVEERKKLRKQLTNYPFVKKIHASDANFVLVQVNKPNELWKYLTSNEVIVRNRSKEVLCEGCLRITIGTPEENQHLVALLNNYHEQ